MKRREFFNWVGLGLMASYFPVALAACSNSETSGSDDIDKERSLSIGTIAQLEESGYLLDKEAKVLVIQDREGELMAVNPTCTHQGCTVDWSAEENQFACPCHNAKFTSDGKVLAKPAPSPLPTYQVTENDGTILVRLT